MRRAHVITPFSRPLLLSRLLPLLEGQNITWHPILASGDVLGASTRALSWVKPVISGNSGGYDPCYWKLNYWLGTQPIEDDDLYAFSGDDDVYPVGFFDSVRGVNQEETLVVSSRYRPGRTMTASRANCQVNKINLAQYIVTGKIARMMRFLNWFAADGAMAEWLARHTRCVFRPELYMVHNALRPGWWTDRETGL